jgi:hypothetical protein
MIAFAELSLLAALAASSIAAPAVDPQGGSSSLSYGGSSSRSPSPGSGTPEPATMLLLAGGALGYGAYRLRRRNSETPKDG